jgi:(R,R)-butanediol dehydrogenase / meso-butanediol dehydrogenase / diacetyl reductase
VVLGLGPIGLQTAQVLLAKGVSPVIGAALGLTVVDGAADLITAIEPHMGAREVMLVFEASGASMLVRRAMELVRPRGVVVIVALYAQTGADRRHPCGA